jgi:hypothetical protein
MIWPLGKKLRETDAVDTNAPPVRLRHQGNQIPTVRKKDSPNLPLGVVIGSIILLIEAWLTPVSDNGIPWSHTVDREYIL